MFSIKSDDLEIKEYWNRSGKDLLELEVPFPKNYPKTKFRKNSDKIAYLQIDFENSRGSANYIYLTDFYVFLSKAHEKSKFSTSEEIQIAKGLGKKMLCYAINLLIDRKIINKDTTKLFLYASGGSCDSDTHIEDILKKFSVEDMNDWIKNNLYSTEVAVKKLLSLSKKAKATEICAAMNNSKLVKYYEQYGLKENKDEKINIAKVSMSGYVRDVLKKCSVSNISPRRASSSISPKLISSPRRANPRRASPRRATSKKQKPCRVDQIRNPRTGRCVLKTSPLGKQILKAKSSDSRRANTPIRRVSSPRRPSTLRKSVSSPRLPSTRRRRVSSPRRDSSSKSHTSNSDIKYSIKPTLSDGNCFYSAIFRSLKDKNLLDKFCDCIKDISCLKERKFIKTFRSFIVEKDESISMIYSNIFNNMIENFKNVDFQLNFKEIVKDMGDTRDVLIKFNEKNKFKNKYLEKFINKIKNVIKEDRSYVGQIEVEESLNLIKECDIFVEIFTNRASAVKFIKKQNSSTINNTIILVLNQDIDHWEYI